MAKVVLGLFICVLATIVAARLAFDATSAIAGEPADEPWAQNKMEFVAWNKEKWTAWIHDRAFEQVPQDPGKWSRHSNVSLAFIDWKGDAWQAKIDGDVFVLAHRGDWKGPTERATALPYRDWTGKNQLRTVAQLRR